MTARHVARIFGMGEDIIDKDAFDQEPFKRDGGYTRLNKIFENKLDEVVNTINEYLYSQSA